MTSRISENSLDTPRDQSEAYIDICGRLYIRPETIDSVSYHRPKSKFFDDISGIDCEVVLVIETARCAHRIPLRDSNEARALYAALKACAETKRAQCDGAALASILPQRRSA